jgi:hypothetical protein
MTFGQFFLIFFYEIHPYPCLSIIKTKELKHDLKAILDAKMTSAFSGVFLHHACYWRH